MTVYKNITLSLPVESIKKLREISGAEDRTFSNMVRVLISRYEKIVFMYRDVLKDNSFPSAKDLKEIEMLEKIYKGVELDPVELDLLSKMLQINL